MTRLTKIFFGQIDKEKLLKSQNYERGFWDFEDVFIIQNEPVNWEHGVFQYFFNNPDEFWSTITDNPNPFKSYDIIALTLRFNLEVLGGVVWGKFVM